MIHDNFMDRRADQLLDEALAKGGEEGTAMLRRYFSPFESLEEENLYNEYSQFERFYCKQICEPINKNQLLDLAECIGIRNEYVICEPNGINTFGILSNYTGMTLEERLKLCWFQIKFWAGSVITSYYFGVPDTEYQAWVRSVASDFDNKTPNTIGSRLYSYSQRHKNIPRPNISIEEFQRTRARSNRPSRNPICLNEVQEIAEEHDIDDGFFSYEPREYDSEGFFTAHLSFDCTITARFPPAKYVRFLNDIGIQPYVICGLLCIRNSVCNKILM